MPILLFRRWLCIGCSWVSFAALWRLAAEVSGELFGRYLVGIDGVRGNRILGPALVKPSRFGGGAVVFVHGRIQPVVSRALARQSSPQAGWRIDLGGWVSVERFALLHNWRSDWVVN